MKEVEDQFIAYKKAIEYIKSNPDGDKISFSDGFEYAMKLVKNHSDLSNVRLSSKAETIKVIRNRAEHFENIGNHKHAEIECRCAIDIIERLVPPDNFQDEA